MISTLDIVVLILTILIHAPAISVALEHERFTSNPGTFLNPAADVRPKFRYWLPDASIDPAGIAADIKQIGSIGAGGIELCNYYLYGGQVGNPVTDWSIYGFGTPAYNKILRAAAQATKDNGLVIDLALGPESGQGVPAEWDNPGLAYDLVSYNVKIASGGVYHGKIPGHGNGTLLSVTTAAILNSTEFSEPNVGRFSSGFTNWTVWSISADSLKEVTNQVLEDGSISIHVPKNEAAKSYFLWASYYKLSSARAAIPGQNPQSFIQNGSFAVDHFSARGAKVTTDFLEKYVFINGVAELFRRVGKYIWEDSVEVRSSLFWTPDLANSFRKMHGYDIGKYAMLLAAGNGLSFGTTNPDRVYTDAPDRGQGYVSDYRTTMTSLLTLYYEHLVEWSERFLGLEFSGQVGYNLSVDMLEVVPAVGAPEDESLGFGSSIDNYRQYVGPANLAGKKIISNEMGAVFGGNYQQQLPTLLTLTKQAYSGGNNQMVFHGATYSYQYPNTTWPGYNSFGYYVSEQHSRHQPGWDNGYLEVMDFVARNNHVLQSGTPKRDIVFWSKKTRETEAGIVPVYEHLDLVEAGYGYEYISPSNFKLPLSAVKKEVLAPDGPEYKLLILRSTELLTTDGVDKLVQYAQEGLPVMISGGMPNQIASSQGLSAARSKLKSITSLPNVHMVAAGPLASAVASIGIEPLTKVSSSQTWYTYWRQISKVKEAYVYIYNDGNSSSTGSISFATTKLPFFLNAWTGDQTPVNQYTVTRDRTTIPLTLAPKQSIVVAFLGADSEHKRPLYVTSGPSPVLGYSRSKSNDLIVQVPFLKSNVQISTSDGKQHEISAKNTTPEPFILQDWTLVAEKWGPPANFDDASASSSKVNTTYQLPSLLSWPLIPGLQNTSGVGYYSNSFSWNNTSVGALIDFGRVVHTLRVSINGHRLPPLDVTSARTDISTFLKKGRNEVIATVSTTMSNGLRPYWDKIMTSGMAPNSGSMNFSNPEVEAGLVGQVVVTPYEEVFIRA
ncbi:hypothetical protein BKA64DRAFT_738388 [Cadophora sp. MPI-SDFR-AT-0126]|nr:hypothetical protein BKA64DRAFT_738388 [Leotiomycetes sp. MPI-SDFR-AT-0126]